MANLRSLIIVATPDPAVRLTLRWRGRPVFLVLPPTYYDGPRRDGEIIRALEELLPGGSRLSRINAPKKLLAVRSGLAQYGRNNITYVPGLGSFYRLALLCSDLPSEDSDWVEPSTMSACTSCVTCARACPTGAITEERFLLRAERCIAFWNEQPPEVPFPEWLDKDWHNCLVGCLDCQLACPVNRGMLQYEDLHPELTEAEAKAIVSGRPAGDLPPGLREKLERWDLLDWLETLPRNLSVHLDKASGI
jgi:epoxyqueuosine reductase